MTLVQREVNHLSKVRETTHIYTQKTIYINTQLKDLRHKLNSFTTKIGSCVGSYTAGYQK